MKIVGITGGIGSGKSTIAHAFENHGVSTYSADIAAKRLMRENVKLKESIIVLLGDNSYINGQLNRKWIGETVFNHPDLLYQLNQLVHPAVALDFKEWLKKQTGCYVLYEAAILIESGGVSKCDDIILVTASREARIERVMERDSITREAVLARMNNQSSDYFKRKYSQFEFKNEEFLKIGKKVKRLHKKLMKKYACNR